MSRMKARQQQFIDPERGPVLTPRFAVAVLLIVVGIAWVAYYYIGVRPGPNDFNPKTGDLVYGGISFFGDLKK